ncbi:MAG: hypothetical protein AB7S39_22160 [Gemmatimonadales bacterium]
MVALQELWLPIVVATVLTFLAGSVLHMMLPLHKKDWQRLPDEDAAMDRIRQLNPPPGNYMFPAPSGPDDLKNPEFQARMERGPVGLMILRAPGRFSMGPLLVRMVLYHLVVSILVAYVAGRSLAPGIEYLRVFQIAGTTAILGYSAAVVPFGIWYGPPARFTLNQIIDGVVWGLLTAGVYGWLWPR